MARRSRPWYWQKRGRWCVTIKGTRHDLGPDEAEAFRQFGRLLSGDRQAVDAGGITVKAVCASYIEWLRRNRTPRQMRDAIRLIALWLDAIPDGLTVASLRPHHVSQWADARPIAATGRRNLMRVPKEAFAWATKEGRIESNPLAKLSLPSTSRPKVDAFTRDQVCLLIAAAYAWCDDEFADGLQFLYLTGARPQELRAVERHHVDLGGGVIRMTRHEAKAKRKARLIIVNSRVRPIVERMLARHPQGHIWRGRFGEPLTANAVLCRMGRLRKRLGFPVPIYGLRHTYATERLMESMNPATLAELMGTSIRMIEEHYGHLSARLDHLRAAAEGGVPARGK